MKAAIYTEYGTPDVVQIKEVLKPIINNTYTLSDIQSAHRHVEGGHQQGNSVIKL